MPGMPSSRHIEHKNSHDWNYKRYEENLSKLFESPGKMKPGKSVGIDNYPPCGSCKSSDSNCGKVIIRGSSMCVSRRSVKV